MFMTVYQSKYVTFNIDVENSILEAIWTDNYEIVGEIYKNEMLQARKIVEEYRPKYCLADNRNFYFRISPELQIWVSENIFQKNGEEIIKYYAFIFPPDVLASILLEQMMEESNRQQMTKGFATMEEAKEWLVLLAVNIALNNE